MQAFEVSDSSPDVFLVKVREALTGRALGQIASLSREGQELVVKFSRLGTSEVRYRIDTVGAGFRATKSSEKIALAHRAFRDDIESRLQKTLEKLGARF